MTIIEIYGNDCRNEVTSPRGSGNLNRNNDRTRYILPLLLLLFSIIPFKGFASIIHNCHYNSSSLLVEKEQDWDVIQIKGLGLIEETNKPALPVDYIHLLLPLGMTAESIRVRINSMEHIPGEYRIKPSSLSLDNPMGYQNSPFYQSDKPYPGIRAKIAGTGNFRGNKIAKIAVYPLSYFSKSGRIELFTDLEIELFYKPAKKMQTKQIYQTPHSEQILKKALNSIVNNDYDIPAYSYHPQITSIGRNDPSYLIITADSLRGAFQTFVNWLTRKGIKTITVSIDSILSVYSYDPISNIHDSAGALRGFLLDEYTNGMQWVLLGGDESIIPVRYGTSGNNDSTVDGQMPSDLYYSDLDGNWNVDGDNYYGESSQDSVDIYPELFVGRLLCSNSEEINNWIEKLFSYETNPGNGDFGYLTKVFWTGADEVRNAPKNIIELGSFPLYFTQDTSMLEDSYDGYTGGYDPRGSAVISKMDEHFGWFNHYGHGAPDQLTVSALHYNEAGPDRDFLVSLDSCEEYFYSPVNCRVEPGNGLDSLHNKDYYGIMYLSSCYQGAYDYEHFALFDNYCGPSIAKAFTLLPERGGMAFLGFTRSSTYISPQTLHLRFTEVLFQDSITSIGTAEAISKTLMPTHYIHLSHTLFGDPQMPIWTDIPKIMNVSFDDSIPPDSIDFQITITASGNPLKGTYVCGWKGDEVYATGFSDDYGELILSIKPETEGIMFLTATKDNFIPCLDTVYVSFDASVSEKEQSAVPLCRTSSSLCHKKVLFEFYLPDNERVQLDIFDLTGRRITRLLNKSLKNGTHRVVWNGSNSKEKHSPSGIYFFRFQYRNQTIQGKFLFLR
ncbi:hypothetical protein KAW18_16920 [candidate division WOR-3 bacterium]|nr:hypothetical protein [candidate division WOR-3 bacterium]